MFRIILAVCLLIALTAARASALGFHLSSMGTINVDSKTAYYDGTNEPPFLFNKALLPVGATALQFSVTGRARPSPMPSSLHPTAAPPAAASRSSTSIPPTAPPPTKALPSAPPPAMTGPFWHLFQPRRHAHRFG